MLFFICLLILGHFLFALTCNVVARSIFLIFTEQSNVKCLIFWLSSSSLWTECHITQDLQKEVNMDANMESKVLILFISMFASLSSTEITYSTMYVHVWSPPVKHNACGYNQAGAGFCFPKRYHKNEYLLKTRHCKPLVLLNINKHDLYQFC